MAVQLKAQGYSATREQEEAWRALPESEQPHLVCFMGILGYGILAVCDTEAEAEEMLALWSIFATITAIRHSGTSMSGKTLYGKGMPVKGYTRCASPHDFQIRTQASLDHLTDAILSSYR